MTREEFNQAISAGMRIFRRNGQEVRFVTICMEDVVLVEHQGVKSAVAISELRPITDKSHVACEQLKTSETAFNWDDFKTGKIAVHCETEELARDFLGQCQNKGLMWTEGQMVTSDGPTHWEYYRDHTAYSLYDHRVNVLGLKYSPVALYEEDGYEIVKWKLQNQVTNSDMLKPEKLREPPRVTFFRACKKCGRKKQFIGTNCEKCGAFIYGLSDDPLVETDAVKLIPVLVSDDWTMRNQLEKIKEEVSEAIAAFDNVERYDLCEELVDIQVACETALNMLGCNINNVRDKVNEKNRARGYLDESN